MVLSVSHDAQGIINTTHYGKEEFKMKTAAMLLAAIIIFAGCSAKEDEMISDVKSDVSSAIDPDKSSSSHIEESRSDIVSQSSTPSESNPLLGEGDARIVR